MNHQNMKDKRILNKVNAGFTLVEMIVVLTIMAIMMGGAVWGVTGWIAHYEYVSSEEKAKTIYMAAQSALSAAESRGTLDEYMKSFEGVTDGIIRFEPNSGDTDIYGIQLKTDNEGNIHEYGYMVVKTGDYIAHPEKPLFKMLEAYISDAEQLNSSIVVEFDLTANKVYSAFYSNWATSLQYSDSDACVERGDFYIKADNRKPEFRENYQVGYYSSDQVNVVKLDNLPQIEMVECMLHNEEILFLTMKSSSNNAESDTVFNINILEDIETRPVLCSFSISRSMFLHRYNDSDKNKPVIVEKVPVYDSLGNKINDFDFIVSLNECEKAEDGYYLSVVLDALSTDQTLAMLDNADTTTGRTGNASYSITRLIGTEPKNIIASVAVEQTGSNSSSRSLESEPENSLYATKEETGEHAKYFDNDNAYLISRNRHLSNIRYVEDYNYKKEKDYQYILTKDLDFDDAVIYDVVNKPNTADFSYHPISKDDAGFVFPMIPNLNEKSLFDGEGNQLTNFKLSNKSAVVYEHGVDGKVISANEGELPVNKATAVGLFGINKGMIKRLIISKAVAKVMSKEEYDKSDGATGSDATRKAIYSDSIQAAGVLCGRNEGDLREIYFDKDCKLEASVFANLDDEQEAKDNGIDTTVPAQSENLNQKYGSGVGMAAGTVSLKTNASIERIFTSGKVKGKITGTADNYKEAPDVSDENKRADIYNETPDTANGENVSNAQYYSYGVGGVFGYVYGKYVNGITKFGIGVDKETVQNNNTPSSTDDSHYITMKKRGSKVTTEVLSADGGKKNVTSYDVSDTLLFAADETRSIINKADVTGDDVSFVGGIVGNLYIADLRYNKVTQTGEDGYKKISASAHSHMINCSNYGDITGNDFVGGVVGVNGDGGYIEACESYGSLNALKGVSAGIASENFGFMKNCLVDRAAADEDNDNKPYVPQIKGNMLASGAITSVNHENSIVYDCDCAIANISGVDDKIVIIGNDMDTFGYLVGRNDGIVDSGRTGRFLDYQSHKTKLTIGGAVGTNSDNAVVNNIEVTFNFVDEGQAECVGGVVGLNKGDVNNCKFGGNITKVKNSTAGMTIGGIVGKNGVKKNVDSDPTVNAVIKNSYVIGAVINAKGRAYYNESSSEKQKLASSSAVGGVCGINYQYSKVENCYVTYLKKDDNNTQSSIEATDGMVGGICAVNMGDLYSCGYTDNEFVMNNGRLIVDGNKTADMSLVNDAVTLLQNVSSDDKKVARPAVKSLNELFKNEETEEIKTRAEELLGTTPDDKDNDIYALSKDDPKYDVSANDYIISLNKGKGYVGGIAGYNTTSGKVRNCASGKWVVENYLPRVKYNAVGGVIGMNSADDKVADSKGGLDSSVAYNINFAYVRNELPDIPSDKLNGSGQVTDKDNYDHTFYYVGGVIGTQNNVTNPNWTVEKCVNVGTVLNYFGNNAGGVIAQLKGNGGTVQYAYNYGRLMTGYTCNFSPSNGYSGTSGGIVAHYTELMPDQVNNVLHCQNHGVIAFPMKGLDYDTCKIKTLYGKMTSNDVGGVVGEISAPQSVDLYTVNIRDCVNGVDARVYANSKSAGILGTIGCFAKEGLYVKNAVNSIFVNIDMCRSYTSHLYSAQGRGVNSEFTRNAGAINSGRDPYDTKSPITGYTTVRNCFGVRMFGYNTSNGNDMISADSDDRGAVSYYKSGTHENNSATYKYCGNNYYMDEISFQYNENKGILGKIFDSILGIFGISNSSNHANRVNALISYGNYSFGFPTIGNSNINYCNKISMYYNDTSNLASERIISATYMKNNGDIKYILFKEPKGFNPNDFDEDNTYISTDEKNVHLRRRTSESTTEQVLYQFTEKGSQAPYNYKLVDHFYFDRLKKSKDYRDKEASNNSGTDLQAKVSGSRLPTADEYDIDYSELDNCFVDYIENTINDKPDTIKNVQVNKSDTLGSYEVKWDVEASDGKAVSATEFDVRIRYIAVNKNSFNESNIDTYLTDNLVVDEPEYKIAYGTTTTFVQPDNLMTDTNMDYYAIVDVKDARGKTEADYKDTARGYVKLVPKMATPDVEIVQYGDKWVLHLKNADDYKAYANNSDTPNFKVHAYTLNGKNEDKKVDILSKDLTFSTDEAYKTQILSNTVSAMVFSKELAGQEIYFVAKADNCISSDKAMITAYIPGQCNPTGMDYELNPDSDGDHLGEKKPYYTGTLTYKTYGSGVSPTIPQLFKVELYGVKKDSEGKELHYTLAQKEVYLSEGESEDIRIGYFDSASGVKFDYDEYMVKCWYAGTGQGAFTYFETQAEFAEGKARTTGFITDISEGTPKYYFHPVDLPEPKVEIVCMDRNPSWYARLLNPEDYEGTDAEIVCLEDTACKISTSNKIDNGELGTLLGYAAKMTASLGKRKRTFVAKKGGYYDSPAFTYSPNGEEVNLQKNLESEVKVSYKLEGTFVIEERDVDDNVVKDLKFDGSLSYNCANSINEYYRYEIYAYNDKNEAVTLLLSDDQTMERGSTGKGNTYNTNTPLNIEIKGDDENNYIDIGKYHDFHVAVWYADGDINTNEVGHKGFAQYIELTEEQAKAPALGYYDEANDSFSGARNKGLLIDISGGEGNYKYYYVAPLKDKRYGDTKGSKYKDYVLYRECTNTISSVKTISYNEENGVVSWEMNPTYYGEPDGSDIDCDVDIRIYEINKPESTDPDNLEDPVNPSRDDLEKMDKFDGYTTVAHGKCVVLPTETKKNDYNWDNNYYYALVRVKDKDADYDGAYCDPIVVKMVQPLILP